MQVGFALDELLRRRELIGIDGPVYAGVMVVASASMARKLSADVPQLRVPDDWITAVEEDPTAGVERACALVEAIEASGAFDGVHLIPVSKYREVASRLEGRA
jgi:5,10-methylenetetrahydrofolate reductase